MNKQLFKFELKSNLKIFMIFIVILSMYVTIINEMYNPEMGQVLNEMAESMPQFFALFGMVNPGTTLLDFYVTYLYGFILVVIPVILSVILSYTLMAKHIENKTMAYFLNTGISRKKIIINQVVIITLTNLIIMTFVTVLMLVVGSISYPQQLVVSDLITINIYLLFLQLCLSAFAFFFASVCNGLKYSVGIPAISILVFVLINMLSQVGDAIKFVNNMNPLNLFQPQLILNQDSLWILYAAILLLITVCFFIASVKVFEKKDLHL